MQNIRHFGCAARMHGRRSAFARLDGNSLSSSALAFELHHAQTDGPRQDKRPTRLFSVPARTYLGEFLQGFRRRRCVDGDSSMLARPFSAAAFQFCPVMAFGRGRVVQLQHVMDGVEIHVVFFIRCSWRFSMVSNSRPGVSSCAFRPPPNTTPRHPQDQLAAVLIEPCPGPVIKVGSGS